ncbi:MAG: response regulator [Bacteroidota bacterium]|nr:response regulator [Bacteroidota bacterium]MDP4196887.1 response regulator [Bacteroidota bacterium]
MDENFFKKLLATYKIEAQEHLQIISSGLLGYERSSDKIEKETIIEEVYRAAHSLKGASRAVNQYEIESLCKGLESTFSSLKKGEFTAGPGLLDIILKAVDLIDSYIITDDEEKKSGLKEEMSLVENEITNISYSGAKKQDERSKGKKSEGSSDAKDKKVEKENEGYKESKGYEERSNSREEQLLQRVSDRPLPTSDTVRIAVSKLDSIFLQAEQLISIRLSSEQTAKVLNDLQANFNLWKKEWTKVNSAFRKIKSQTDPSKNNKSLISFLEWNNDFFTGLSEKVRKLSRDSGLNNRQFGQIVNELMDDVKQVLMLPFSSLTDLFPKLVRDLSRDLNKEVELNISGMEIQADRRILEEMHDPFIHLIRNCIDHGIEMPAERIRKGKDQKGRIDISVSRLGGNKLEIIIEDDGRGIDSAKVKKSAVDHEIITEDEAKGLQEHEALMLIFNSGVSTSRTITDISGHGLGLAIVGEKVDKLGGSIKVETKPDLGTKFIIQLPHSLATFRGILLSCSGRLFVLPALNVEQVLKIKTGNIKTVENKETITVNNIPVSLVYLSDVLELHKKEPIYSNGGSFINIIILKSNEKRIAFVVDEVLYEQEILIKPFNKQLARLKNISAATILGDGKVVPVLNPSDLIRSAEKYSASETLEHEETIQREEVPGSKNILVVDDSITSRMLLKDILESSGYNVKTAIDGIDAITALKVDSFDLVVSDIEMPRMDGFEFTRNVRNEQKLSSIPVVLVTALSRKEDREKGIDAGANAYIVKSNFDQSNLLDTIKRLI